MSVLIKLAGLLLILAAFVLMWGFVFKLFIPRQYDSDDDPFFRRD